MADFVIDNFQFGLDTRRSELTSKPGTLEAFVNGHINQGGEIEKRKEFTRTALPTNSFGLENTSSGPTVFGSVATGALAPALPAGYTYQRLQHPDGTTDMTSVVSSSSYGGNAWVIAKFADGNVYGYYAGAIVYDFTNGVILASETTNALISAELVAEANRLPQYTAVQKAIPNANEFDLFSTPGATYGVNITTDTVLGTLTDAAVSTGQAATTAIPAVGSFQIVAGTQSGSTNKVTLVKINGTDILGTAVNFVTDINHTATAVASQINTHQTTYVATASGNSITLTTSAGGTTANGFVVEITCAGNVCIGQCVFSLTLATGATSFNVTSFIANGVDVLNGSAVNWPGTTLAGLATALAAAIVASVTPGGYTALATGNTIYFSKLVTSSVDGPISLTINVSTGGGVVAGTTNPLSVSLNPTTLGFTGPYGTISSSVTALVFGGAPPYTYVWTFVSSTSLRITTISNVNAQTVTFTNTLLVSGATVTVTDTYLLTVSDSAGATAVIGLNVTVNATK